MHAAVWGESSVMIIICLYLHIYVTGFVKTNRIITITEIHFIA